MIQRQDRSEAPVDELEAEDHAHQQQEVLEREDATGNSCAPAHASDASARCVCRSLARTTASTSSSGATYRSRRSRETRCAGRRAPASTPPITGSDRRTKPLRGLHGADRRGHALARRRLGRHRTASARRSRRTGRARRAARTAARARDERHRRHHDDAGDERPHDHDLAAEAIGEASPQRRHRARSAPA